MIPELETVVLLRDLPADGLVVGDIGTIVYAAPGGSTLVEFVLCGGRTVALAELGPGDIRLLADDEILHARPLRRIAHQSHAGRSDHPGPFVHCHFALETVARRSRFTSRP